LLTSDFSWVSSSLSFWDVLLVGFLSQSPGRLLVVFLSADVELLPSRRADTIRQRGGHVPGSPHDDRRCCGSRRRSPGPRPARAMIATGPPALAATEPGHRGGPARSQSTVFVVRDGLALARDGTAGSERLGRIARVASGWGRIRIGGRAHGLTGPLGVDGRCGMSCSNADDRQRLGRLGPVEPARDNRACRVSGQPSGAPRVPGCVRTLCLAWKTSAPPRRARAAIRLPSGTSDSELLERFAARRRAGLRARIRPIPLAAAGVLPAHARQSGGGRGRAAACLPRCAPDASRRRAIGRAQAVAVCGRSQPLPHGVASATAERHARRRR